jgi:hypothetical protein
MRQLEDSQKTVRRSNTSVPKVVILERGDSSTYTTAYSDILSLF